MGCACVIVGHSERRRNQRETDGDLAAKLRQALRHGLVPIYCVGETIDQRKGGATEAVIAGQLEGGLFPVLETEHPCVIAYEPVWAIGTGLTATPDQAQAIHAFIRRWLSRRSAARAGATPILYGGSVTRDNAGSLLASPDVDGALVGGASLAADGFLAIVQAAGAAGQKRGGTPE